MIAVSVPPNILNYTRGGGGGCLFVCVTCWLVYFIPWKNQFSFLSIFPMLKILLPVNELGVFSNFSTRHGLFWWFLVFFGFFQYRFHACYFFAIPKNHNTYIFFNIVLCKDAESLWQSFLTITTFSMLILSTPSAIHYETDQIKSLMTLTDFDG